MKVVARRRMRQPSPVRTYSSRYHPIRIAWVCWSMNTKCCMPVAASPSSSTTGMFPMNCPRGAAASNAGNRSSGYGVPNAWYSASGVKTSSHRPSTSWLVNAMYRAQSACSSTRSAVRPGSSSMPPPSCAPARRSRPGTRRARKSDIR